MLKAVKSWLAFNDRRVNRPIKIKGARETPTLRDERVPTPEELRTILLSGDQKARVICILLAHSGLRREVLGNHSGTDGLSLRDLPELEIRVGQANLTATVPLVRVRPELSKSNHEYFTFLSDEGWQYLRSYLEMRMRRGERLTFDSAIITPKTAAKPFISTSNLDLFVKTPRQPGARWG